MAEEEKDDWLSDVNKDDVGESDVDQSEIDSLLSEDDEAEPSTTAVAEDAATGDAAPAEEENAADSDIESLLADDPEDDSPDASPSQDEIDHLFSEVDDNAAEPQDSAAEETANDPFKAEEIDFKDLAEDAADDDFSLDDVGDGFDTEEFDLDDGAPEVSSATDTEIEAVDASIPSQNTGGSADAAEAIFPDTGGAGKGGFPPVLKNRKIQVAAVVGILLIIAGVFLFKGKPASWNKTTIAKQPLHRIQPAAATPKVAAAVAPIVKINTNTPPQVKDSEVTMAEGDNKLVIRLNATDPGNAPLTYEILSLPEYGKLSGQAPNLIYLPNKNFKGRDHLVFRASNGREVSNPAIIRIVTALAAKPAARSVSIPGQTTVATGPAATVKKPAAIAPHAKAARRKRLVIAARNETYHLYSTRPVKINWKRLWDKANYLPYTHKVRVEIVSANLHGQLHKTGWRTYVYKPDKYFSGTEVIKYRFWLARLRSKTGEIVFKTAFGSPAPEIHIAKLSTSYYAGDRVVLDASSSRGLDRGSLLFTWKQLAGVPVRLEMTNKEGSRVTFVAPASFNTIKNPGPVLRLIITDQDKQRVSRDIKINTKSRRHSAIWDRLAVGGEDF
ncbi:MAG: hypothetical protein GXP59_08690 [Deltaproteobacteria bacterium]|nr:hypothetical protein [Deltaproteobacteria bacterium]